MLNNVLNITNQPNWMWKSKVNIQNFGQFSFFYIFHILKTFLIFENFIFFKKFPKNIFSKLTFWGHFGQNLIFSHLTSKKINKTFFSFGLPRQDSNPPSAEPTISYSTAICSPSPPLLTLLTRALYLRHKLFIFLHFSSISDILKTFFIFENVI